MTLGAVVTALTTSTAILAVIVSYLAYRLNKTKSNREVIVRDTQIEEKLGYISTGVDEIRIDLKANEKQLVQLGERVTRVEESSKQAHRRIDKLEGGTV